MKKIKGNFVVQVEFPKQWVVDQFISACEGGSGYWCKEVDNLNKEGDAYEGMLLGFKVTYDNEEPKLRTKTVTPKMIENGIKLFCKSKHYGDLLSDNFDGVTADVFLQYCCFGEIVYG